MRDNNEDSYACDPVTALWIVADGMGGHGFGEVASAISTYTVINQVRKGLDIDQAIEVAHQRIKEFFNAEVSASHISSNNMATNLELLYSQRNLFNIHWVGDSRAYRFDGALTQLTVDHSLVQSLIDDGEITEEEAAYDPRRNGISKALGTQHLEMVKADSISEKWRPNQKILLCSDGLTDCVGSATIESILGEESSDQEKADKLINRALDAGGKDNVTVVVVSAPESLALASQAGHPPQVTPTLPEQLEIPTLHDRVNPISTVENRDVSSSTADSHPWRDSQKWLLALALIFTVILFARLTTEDNRTDAASMFTSGALIESQSLSDTFVPRGEPAQIDLPVSGQILQTGVFPQLEGAERQQLALTDIGLLPYVQKRPVEDGILFVVLLGPYHRAGELQAATSKLKAGGLNYFELPDSNYK